MKRCKKCKLLVPRVEEAYMDGELLCQICFHKEKTRRKAGKNSSMQKLYNDWVEQSKENEK